MRAECTYSAVVLKEGGGPLCSLDCDPSSRSLSLKVSAQGTNEPLGRERSNPCCPGVMAVPGLVHFFLCDMLLKLSVVALFCLCCELTFNDKLRKELEQRCATLAFIPTA